VTPQAKALLIEAGITIGTALALAIAIQYGPQLPEMAGKAWRSFAAPPVLPMFLLNEQAVAEFRDSLGGPAPDLLTRENWGWTDD
jgi:hypothetical protein